MYRGGCLCGAVRYEAEGPAFHSTLCHCSMCRRAAGAPAVAWFSVRRSGLRIIGTPGAYASSPGITRQFCPHCGTQLTFADARTPEEIDVTTATLDDPELLPPEDHTFSENRLHWMHLGDQLPRYLRTRGDGALESA